jgi:hypothetical protein
MDKLTPTWEVVKKEDWELELEQLEKDDKLRYWSAEDVKNWIKDKISNLVK